MPSIRLAAYHIPNFLHAAELETSIASIDVYSRHMEKTHGKHSISEIRFNWSKELSPLKERKVS